MRSFRAILTLTWVLACYMDASNGEELAREYIYTMPVNEPTLINTCDGYRNCQVCLLDFAGVGRVSLLGNNRRL
ncbi:unnamed protein product [Albugo candida]|uniref:Uncharacterized protein n=1 Tax=Albugo candida TaxID=65357 RepID=A0A024GB83_9STRA|nr:unnamed protein product [Albugo candida]|eukprot:CCI43800.1 unnamed protein product [Albugo candida]